MLLPTGLPILYYRITHHEETSKTNTLGHVILSAAHVILALADHFPILVGNFHNIGPPSTASLQRSQAASSQCVIYGF
jgi:hypothetical protein